jgi:hypothetical protein
VEGRRGYLWVAGVLAKALGAGPFRARPLPERLARELPLFAVTDGSLAVLTALFLLR